MGISYTLIDLLSHDPQMILLVQMVECLHSYRGPLPTFYYDAPELIPAITHYLPVHSTSHGTIYAD